jgi:hypothetical protein
MSSHICRGQCPAMQSQQQIQLRLIAHKANVSIMRFAKKHYDKDLDPLIHTLTEASLKNDISLEEKKAVAIRTYYVSDVIYADRNTAQISPDSAVSDSEEEDY